VAGVQEVQLYMLTQKSDEDNKATATYIKTFINSFKLLYMEIISGDPAKGYLQYINLKLICRFILLLVISAEMLDTYEKEQIYV